MENNDFYDPIQHPSHYTEGRQYEPRKVIRDWGLNFNLGSAVKYLSRAGRKDDILQDLKKAKQFIEFEIEAIEEQFIDFETGAVEEEKRKEIKEDEVHGEK